MTGRSVTALRLVVMGVSGSGKTSIGSKLALRLGLSFQDGDDLHPAENVAKMAAGIPLTDEDRWPWLDLCAQSLNRADGTVIACSALRRSYRDRIRAQVPDAVFIQLSGSFELLRLRMANRAGHFMKENMLQSQLDTLEPLEADEPGITVDVTDSEDSILAHIETWLKHRTS